MAGRHLRDMIAAYGERDDLKFRRAAQAIIQEEEAKHHTVLARELRNLLAVSGSTSTSDAPLLPEPPVDRDSSLPLARIERPDRMLTDLTLSADVGSTLRQLIREVTNWPALDAANLPRRNRVLLSGPPGCGKTSAVAAMAHELGRPLITARVEGLVSSYLGETAANLESLFAFASSGSYVLFLDEFDSLGKTRDDSADHGELRRVVNAVLQQIDAYSGPSLIVAATNHSKILDAALWRRFDSVIEVGLPTPLEIVALVQRLMSAQAFDIAAPLMGQLIGLPHAAAEFFANATRRHALLEHHTSVTQSDVEAALYETTSRPWL